MTINQKIIAKTLRLLDKGSLAFGGDSYLEYASKLPIHLLSFLLNLS